MHTGEDKSETNTNSLEVNDKLKYLAGANAMHTVEDEGETNTNSLNVNDRLSNSANLTSLLTVDTFFHVHRGGLAHFFPQKF